MLLVITVKKSVVLRIATVVLLAAGIAVLFYPAVMNFIFVTKQNMVIEEYNRQIAAFSEEEVSRMRQEAEAYNNKLSNSLDATYDEGVSGNLSYSQLLSVTGNQMGYIVIPRISVNMPIYHSDNEDVLSIGVGHMENTSLPIGGKSTHCVLSGHTGVPDTKIFTDLTEMAVGDRFYIKTLDDILCYEVDQIKVVLPNDTRDLVIVPDRDLVTLLTCTPYGVNSHRLLVRGTRVEYNGELDSDTDINTEESSGAISEIKPTEQKNPATVDQTKLENNKTKLPENFVLFYILLPLVIITALITALIIFRKQKRKKAKKSEGKTNEE